MEQDELGFRAHANLIALGENEYTGRGIIAGLDGIGKHLVQVYWITGRSENSRNRVLSAEGGRLYTEAADPSKVKDPSLIIYNAMREWGAHFVVSNGDQTDTVVQNAGISGLSLGVALRGREYEPDEPNYTQRITAMCSLGEINARVPSIQMSILRKSAFGKGCDRLSYLYESLSPGIGFCITTYAGDGSPLPAFRGDPLLMPLEGDMRQIADTYWDVLNKENLVSLAVKFIQVGGGSSKMYISNRSCKVS